MVRVTRPEWPLAGRSGHWPGVVARDCRTQSAVPLRKSGRPRGHRPGVSARDCRTQSTVPQRTSGCLRAHWLGAPFRDYRTQSALPHRSSHAGRTATGRAYTVDGPAYFLRIITFQISRTHARPMKVNGQRTTDPQKQKSRPEIRA